MTTDASKSHPFPKFDNSKNIDNIDDEAFRKIGTLDDNIPIILHSGSSPTGSTSSRISPDPTKGDNANDDGKSHQRMVLNDDTLICTSTTTRSSVFSAMEHEKLHNILVLQTDPAEKENNASEIIIHQTNDNLKEQLPDPPEERPPSDDDDIVDDYHHQFQHATNPGPPFRREWMRSLLSAGDEIGPLNDHETHILFRVAMDLPLSFFSCDHAFHGGLIVIQNMTAMMMTTTTKTTGRRQSKSNNNNNTIEPLQETQI